LVNGGPLGQRQKKEIAMNNLSHSRIFTTASLENPRHRSSRREEAHISTPHSCPRTRNSDQSLVTSAATNLRRALFAAALLLSSIGSALAEVHYVDVNSTNATPPYFSWSTAATNIQDAVDAAMAGDEILVTNGIYATGGRDGNRVKVDKQLNVRSVNGPQFTSIDGGGSNRCASVTDGATLSNFTLTNGYSFYYGGGGVFCGPNAIVSNCVITGNRHDLYQESPFGGGGAYGGTLNNCTLTGNSAIAADFSFFGHSQAYGGGAYASTLNNCTLSGNLAQANVGQAATAYAYGGGAAYCTLNNCVLSSNRAASTAPFGSVSSTYVYGGGAFDCTLNNCTLSGNSALYSGGAYGCTLNNCTLTGNRGTGANSSALNNCIAYFNGENYNSCTLNYSCTTPQPTNGVGNITNAPLFAGQASGNLRLQSNSPCINAGLNAFAPAGPDLDGNPRIVGGRVDMGAYEYQSLDLISFGGVSNQFRFNVTGQSNWVIVLEASSNFTNWTALTTNTLNGRPFPFRDPTPPNLPQRFYRARQELP
jgi:hypothetical protein